jgi:predicted TIM-barrel fold metal-dependent hydrolase
VLRRWTGTVSVCKSYPIAARRPLAESVHANPDHWGWQHEAGIQVIRMILSGTFDGYPDLQVISVKWGETASFYLQRLYDTLPRKRPAFPARSHGPTRSMYT